MKIPVLVVGLLMLSGCSVLSSITGKLSDNERNSQDTNVLDNAELCVVVREEANLAHNCDMAYWLNLWLVADDTPWLERKQSLSSLDNSMHDTLLRYFFTLPNDTPYQERLGAQLSIDAIEAKMTPAFARVIRTVAMQQNKQLMELESALSVLVKQNATLSNEMSALTTQLQEQQKKINALLKIETTLMDKSRSSK
jgi:hypothetical protein